MGQAFDAVGGSGHRAANAERDTGIIGNKLLVFYAGVVLVQGIHVVEHVIQLFQVYAFDVPEDDALGLLGYVYQFQGTEEWLHLSFNSFFLASLLVIAFGLLRSPATRAAVPSGALAGFLIFGPGLEAWHVVEHAVIISNVLANDGCPCPGILDARLGLSDTVLHFGYNAVAFGATLLPFPYLRPDRLLLPMMLRRSSAGTRIEPLAKTKPPRLQSPVPGPRQSVKIEPIRLPGDSEG